MMTKLLLLQALLYALTILTVNCTQKRAISDKPSLLTAALCLDDDGAIREVCLESISTRRLLEEIYSRMSEERNSKSSNRDRLELSPEVPADASLAEKRAREKMSGFYSNW